MAAEALELVRAGAEARVEVERGDRPARPLPEVVGAGDQHDRPVEPLYEPRGDDPDHALVPPLVREHVAAVGPASLRPGLDLRERLAEDALLDRLPLAVQRLELRREAPRPRRVVGEQELERRRWVAEPAG